MRLLLVSLLLATSPVVACEATVMPGPYGQRQSLANCSSKVQHDSTSSAYLSEASDLGNGFVLQHLSDGHGCGSNEVNTLVQDCTTGDVAVFGDIYLSAMTAEPLPPSASLDDAVKARAAAGNPLSTTDILAEARKRGTEFVLETKTTKPLSINGHVFSIGCGCRTFYHND